MFKEKIKPGLDTLKEETIEIKHEITVGFSEISKSLDKIQLHLIDRFSETLQEELTALKSSFQDDVGKLKKNFHQEVEDAKKEAKMQLEALQKNLEQAKKDLDDVQKKFTEDLKISSTSMKNLSGKNTILGSVGLGAVAIIIGGFLLVATIRYMVQKNLNRVNQVADLGRMVWNLGRRVHDMQNQRYMGMPMADMGNGPPHHGAPVMAIQNGQPAIM